MDSAAFLLTLRLAASTTAVLLTLALPMAWWIAAGGGKVRAIVQALVAAGKHVSYVEIESELGHDDFLMPIAQYHRVLKNYLDRVAAEQR